MPIFVDDGATPVRNLHVKEGGAARTVTRAFTKVSGAVREIPLWVEQAKLVADDGQTSDDFGRSVAVDGDTVVVGAIRSGDTGAAYVFTRSGSSWSQQAKLVSNDIQDFDRFGDSVAIDGDTIVVGAAGEDTGGDFAGAAYVFTRSGSTWSQQAKLVANDAAGNDIFGRSVAIDGDTVVVGAYRSGTGGAAYVFTRSGSSWSQQAKLEANDAQPADYFGLDVAVSGNTVVAGAQFQDVVYENSGAAYVFTRSGSTWTQQAKLAADDPVEDGAFGRSVAVDGDTIVAGAYRGQLNYDNPPGSAYVFTRSGSTWSQQAKLTADDGGINDGFGDSVTLEGSIVAVGAHPYLTELGVGAAYIFAKSGTSWVQQSKLVPADAANNDELGISISLKSGVLVIGAEAADVGSTSFAGAAYVF